MIEICLCQFPPTRLHQASYFSFSIIDVDANIGNQENVHETKSKSEMSKRDKSQRERESNGKVTGKVTGKNRSTEWNIGVLALR